MTEQEARIAFARPRSVSSLSDLEKYPEVRFIVLTDDSISYSTPGYDRFEPSSDHTHKFLQIRCFNSSETLTEWLQACVIMGKQVPYQIMKVQPAVVKTVVSVVIE